MIYQAPTGNVKDPFVFWHDGRYYLFAMYAREAEPERRQHRHVWGAVSDDGVHFRTVGEVIADAPFPVWAMSVHEAGGRFILNHGSFGPTGRQNVIRFWESSDLRHWTYRGADTDLYPNPCWYSPESRLDCMSVLRFDGNGVPTWYGYATGPGGFLRSDDGLHWHGLPPLAIDWAGLPAPPTPADEGPLEYGACQQIGARFYLLGGWFNYMGTSGYGVFTLVADHPAGPFRPDPAAYRLCGNSQRWVAMWARFCPTPDAMLVARYLYSGYTYETGETFIPPLLRAEVDPAGHLRLAYWRGNEALKGPALAFDLGQARRAGPGAGEVTATAESLRLRTPHEVASFARLNLPTLVAVHPQTLDVAAGVVVEGTVTVTCGDPRVVAPAVGWYLEEAENEGTAMVLDATGVSRCGRLTLVPEPRLECEDEIGPGCASVAGIAPHQPHTFRLLARGNLFELYLDDRLVQTLNTTHAPGPVGRTPRRLGFLVQNGNATFSNVRAWQMSL